VTDIRKEIVTLLWLTVRDTTLAKGFRLGHEGQGYKLSVPPAKGAKGVHSLQI